MSGPEGSSTKAIAPGAQDNLVIIGLMGISFVEMKLAIILIHAGFRIRPKNRRGVEGAEFFLFILCVLCVSVVNYLKGS